MILPIPVSQRIRAYDSDLIKEAQGLAEGLKESRERQIRNMMEAAEQATCWAAVKLFIRYQAARKQIEGPWAERLIQQLEKLREKADGIAGETKNPVEAVHLALIVRFLGYLLRWDKVRFGTESSGAAESPPA